MNSVILDRGPTFGGVRRSLEQRIVTTAGDYVVQSTDFILIFRKAVPTPFSVLLPDCRAWMQQPYGGLDLILKDGANNAATYPVSIVPYGAQQTLDGLNTAALPGGVWSLAGNGASIRLSPLVDGSGWSLVR